ncbi:hypothetical protein MTBSS4_10101 [Magnetospirillum sp. SS-4]|nr:hypothetical protein MTBSS4_10101 [Magnetospirillum sp. SS-4]
MAELAGGVMPFAWARGILFTYDENDTWHGTEIIMEAAPGIVGGGTTSASRRTNRRVAPVLSDPAPSTDRWSARRTSVPL